MFRRLIVIPSAEHLLACGSEQQCVFVLRNIAPCAIHERRILINDIALHQFIQGRQMIALLAVMAMDSVGTSI